MRTGLTTGHLRGAAAVVTGTAAMLLTVSGATPAVAHGTLETPEFQRQNRDFAAAVKAAGKPLTFLIGEGYTHFEMFETLGNPYGLLGRAMLAQMKLTAVCS